MMDGVYEAVALAVDAAALALCLRQYLKWRSTLRKLQLAPEFDLDVEAPTASAYACVSGCVRPLGETLKGGDGVEGVVRRVTVREHVTARTAAGFWSDESRVVYEQQVAVPFCLFGRRAAVEVADALAAHTLDLDVVADRFEPLAPSLLDHVWGFFSGVRRRGLQTTEEMLREGARLTAVGELNIVMRPPADGTPSFLVAGARAALLRKIDDSQATLRLLALAFGAVAVALSARLAYKHLRKRRKLAEAESLRRRLASSRKQRRTLGRDGDLPEDRLCVVCADNPKEIVLLPCGHVSLCEDCSDNIKDRCPVCRTPIESRAPAFIT